MSACCAMTDDAPGTPAASTSTYFGTCFFLLGFSPWLFTNEEDDDVDEDVEEEWVFFFRPLDDEEDAALAEEPPFREAGFSAMFMGTCLVAESARERAAARARSLSWFSLVAWMAVSARARVCDEDAQEEAQGEWEGRACAMSSEGPWGRGGGMEGDCERLRLRERGM